MPDISIKNLTYIYPGNVTALKNISVEISGDKIGIIGQNGSGKTTLLGILMGFQKPTNGKIFVDGKNPFKNRDKILKNYTPCFEKVKLPYGIKVKDFIKIIGRIIEDIEYAKDLADYLGIGNFENQALSHLSSGQEQLIWLFNSLVDKTKIPVLDEPFVHLDIHTYRKVSSILNKNFEKYILTSHIPEDIELLTNHIIILEEGKLKWDGNLKELFKDGYYEVYTKKNNIRELKNIIGRFGNIIICKCDRDLLQKLMDDGKILGFKKAGVRALYAKIR